MNTGIIISATCVVRSSKQECAAQPWDRAWVDILALIKGLPGARDGRQSREQAGLHPAPILNYWWSMPLDWLTLEEQGYTKTQRDGK